MSFASRSLFQLLTSTLTRTKNMYLELSTYHASLHSNQPTNSKKNVHKHQSLIATYHYATRHKTRTPPQASQPGLQFTFRPPGCGSRGQCGRNPNVTLVTRVPHFRCELIRCLWPSSPLFVNVEPLFELTRVNAAKQRCQYRPSRLDKQHNM